MILAKALKLRVNERYISIHCHSSWQPAFSLVDAAMRRVPASIVHPTDGRSYFLPASSEPRRFFDLSQDCVLEGAVQFWINAMQDVLVAWKYLRNGILMSIHLGGVGTEMEGDILRAVYVQMREAESLRLANRNIMELTLE